MHYLLLHANDTRKIKTNHLRLTVKLAALNAETGIEHSKLVHNYASLMIFLIPLRAIPISDSMIKHEQLCLIY